MYTVYGYSIADSAAEAIGGTGLVGSYFHKSAAIDEHRQGSGRYLAVGADHLLQPLAVDLQGQETMQLRSTDGGAQVAETINAQHPALPTLGGADRPPGCQPLQEDRGEFITQFTDRFPLGQGRDHRCHEVPAMKGGTDCTSTQSQGFDDTDGVDCILFDEQREDAIVRADKKMTFALGSDNGPIAADPGINDNEMHRGRRKIRITGMKNDGGAQQVPGGDGVGEIDKGRRGAAGEQGPFQLPHIGVIEAEIGGKGNQGRGLLHTEGADLSSCLFPSCLGYGSPRGGHHLFYN